MLNASALLCRSPRRAAPLSAPVEVTLNGQQYTSDGAPFVFTGTARDGTWPAWREQLTVTGLSPVTGPEHGSTLLTVASTGIEDGSHYCCRFTGETHRELGDLGEVRAVTRGRVVVNATYVAAASYVLRPWGGAAGSLGLVNGSASAVQCLTPDTVSPTMEPPQGTLTPTALTAAVARPHGSVGTPYGRLKVR